MRKLFNPMRYIVLAYYVVFYTIDRTFYIWYAAVFAADGCFEHYFLWTLI